MLSEPDKNGKNLMNFKHHGNEPQYRSSSNLIAFTHKWFLELGNLSKERHFLHSTPLKSWRKTQELSFGIVCDPC
jgi:hypothetical protein